MTYIRTYTCMDCDITYTSKERVRMLVIQKVGVVMCLDCLKKNGYEIES